VYRYLELRSAPGRLRVRGLRLGLELLLLLVSHRSQRCTKVFDRVLDFTVGPHRARPVLFERLGVRVEMRTDAFHLHAGQLGQVLKLRIDQRDLGAEARVLPGFELRALLVLPRQLGGDACVKRGSVRVPPRLFFPAHALQVSGARLVLGRALRFVVCD
jgi:hypothetical protein